MCVDDFCELSKEDNGEKKLEARQFCVLFLCRRRNNVNLRHPAVLIGVVLIFMYKVCTYL